MTWTKWYSVGMPAKLDTVVEPSWAAKVLSIDFALTHLMTETRCCQDEADRVAWRRWPKSMTAEENYADADAEDAW